MHIWAIILAAGQGSRLQKECGTCKKQFLKWGGLPLFWHSALSLSLVPKISGVVFVFPQQDFTEACTLVEELCTGQNFGTDCTKKFALDYKCVTGSKERQDSVYAGLAALPARCTHVLVHDSARPFTTPALTQSLIAELENGHDAVIPGLPLSDTIKVIDNNSTVVATPARSSLRAVQTPQAFRLDALVYGHKQAKAAGWQVTDDASILEQCGMPVKVISGEAANIKITNPQDLVFLSDREKKNMINQLVPCVGTGYDVHSYGGTRDFILGGVSINSTDIKVKAHSDGDVLLHALMDALLGCAAAGDIGQLFPDNNEAYDNANSSMLLSEVMELIRAKDIELTHADITIIAQVPKIAPFSAQIKRNVAHLLHLSENCVNIKATTEEGLGFTGNKLGIKALATVTGLRKARV